MHYASVNTFTSLSLSLVQSREVERRNIRHDAETLRMMWG